jgi:endonuclease/exonuclease/phosphatase family metal-dependent hydrolase
MVLSWILLLAALAADSPPLGKDMSCPAPGVEVLADGRARTTLDVLTYNIEGLGWPARTHRAKQLAEIGARLDALRQAGQAPDLVLFQEAFSEPAKAAVRQSGYPAIVHGPRRGQHHRMANDVEDLEGAGRRSIKRGEIGVKFAGSGLAVASRFPITTHAGKPFGSRSCAGLDCLSNKGALFARVAIPGVPDPIDVFDTHMNSRKASKAPRSESLPVHHAEAHELASFIEALRDDDHPTLLGGDFNMRHSEARFDFLEPLMRMTLVERYCHDPAAGCDIRMSFDGDAPWMDTEDLQFFGSGTRVQVRPIRIDTLFDGRKDSPRLSDHDGFRVTYELTWRAALTPRTGGCG